MNHLAIRKIFLSLILLLFSGFVTAGDLPHVPKGINKKGDFCAKNGEKFGHTVIIIDMTTQLHPAEIDEIKGRVFTESFFQKYKPFTKFSYLIMQDKKRPQSLKYMFSMCRPKSAMRTRFGDAEMNSWSESEKFIKRYWKKFIESVRSSEKRIFKFASVDSKETYVYETIVNVFKLEKFDFSHNYPLGSRNMIIISDMMQSTPRVNFYRECHAGSNPLRDECPTYKDFYNSDRDTRDYIDATKPNAKNVGIELIYMNKRYETNVSIDTSLVRLWKDYFKTVGFHPISIDRMTDITTRQRP